MSIPFTQYLQPEGRTRRAEIDRPGEIEDMAQELLEYGWTFEAEVLNTGEVNLTVFDGEQDVVGRVVPNGPAVPNAVDEIVKEAHDEMVLEAYERAEAKARKEHDRG